MCGAQPLGGKMTGKGRPFDGVVKLVAVEKELITQYVIQFATALFRRAYGC